MDYKTKAEVEAHAKPVAEVLEAVLVLNYALAAARAAGWGCAVAIEDETGLVAVEVIRMEAWPAPPEEKAERRPSMDDVIRAVGAARPASGNKGSSNG